MDFQAPHPVVVPNPIGAVVRCDVFQTVLDGVVSYVDLFGTVVDQQLPEDLGSRQRLLPKCKVEVDRGQLVRVMASRAHSGHYVDSVVTTGYHVSVCKPKLYYVGEFSEYVITFIPFIPGYAHCDEVVQSVVGYGGHFVSFLGDVVTFKDVTSFCRQRVALEFPVIEFSYDDRSTLTAVIPRVRCEMNFVGYCRSCWEVPCGYEIDVRGYDPDELKAAFAVHGTFLDARRVSRMRPRRDWVPNLVGIYCRILEENKIISLKESDYYFHDEVGFHLYSLGGNLKCELSVNDPCCPKRVDGKGTLLPVSACTILGPVSCREAFRAFVGTRMHCYRHAEFNDIGKAVPMGMHQFID